MGDLVKTLRMTTMVLDKGDVLPTVQLMSLMIRGADEIDRLRAQLTEAQLKLASAGVKEAGANWDAGVAQLAERESDAVAWGYPNTALTGRSALMQVRLEIPSDDEYRGAHWIPLYTTPQPPAVPDKLDEYEKPDVWNVGYAHGWNAYREAMLATSGDHPVGNVARKALAAYEEGKR